MSNLLNNHKRELPSVNNPRRISDGGMPSLTPLTPEQVAASQAALSAKQQIINAPYDPEENGVSLVEVMKEYRSLNEKFKGSAILNTSLNEMSSALSVMHENVYYTGDLVIVLMNYNIVIKNANGCVVIDTNSNMIHLIMNVVTEDKLDIAVVANAIECLMHEWMEYKNQNMVNLRQQQNNFYQPEQMQSFNPR